MFVAGAFEAGAGIGEAGLNSMDKRYKSLTLADQLRLRQRAIDDVLAHPEWPLPHDFQPTSFASVFTR